ncbi:MAG: polysaccharide biosynthesis protein [Bdellovibrionales bacterium]|nr:polysaccharide biosynthesis protein [Bdellovibrionales bacterium]
MRQFRILLNVLTSLSRNFVGLILGVVATPIILQALGDEAFGAFRVLLDWVSQLGILEFGLFPSLQAVFAKSLSKSSQIHPASISRLAYKRYFQVLVFQGVGLGIIALFHKELIPVSPRMAHDLHMAMIIMGISLLFTFSQIYRAYLDANQRGYVISSTMMLQNIIFIFLSVILALTGYGIRGQALAFLLSIAISFVILFRKTKDELTGSTRSSSHTGAHLSIKEQRTPQFIANLSGRASLLADNLIISALLGAKSVTAFYLTQRLLLLCMQQLQQLSNATWPAMSEIYFEKNKEKFRLHIIEVTEIIALCAGALLSVLAFLNPPFVVLWTGESTYAGLALSSIVVYNVGLISIITFWQWCFIGTGYIKTIIPAIVCQAIVNLGISLFGTHSLGLIGPAIGTLVSFQLITIPWQSHLMKKTFGVSLLKLSRAWIVPFALPTVASLSMVYQWGTPKVESWWQFCFYALVATPLVSVAFFYLLIGAHTRSLFIKRVQFFVARKTKA